MLRIITGTLRGRKLDVPPSQHTRPTTDRVRESLFNLLESYLAQQEMSFEGMKVLDAFAGSGALGFEALSRGAASLTFFEQSAVALKILHHNAAHLELSREAVKIQHVNTLKPPKTSVSMDLIFLDPPYGKDLIEPAYTALMTSGWATDKTLFVLETSHKDVLLPCFDDKIIKQRTYGTTTITLVKEAANKRSSVF